VAVLEDHSSLIAKSI